MEIMTDTILAPLYPGGNQKRRGPPIAFLPLPFPSLSSHPLPFLSLPSLPLEVGPVNAARGSVGAL